MIPALDASLNQPLKPPPTLEFLILWDKMEAEAHGNENLELHSNDFFIRGHISTCMC